MHNEEVLEPKWVCVSRGARKTLEAVSAPRPKKNTSQTGQRRRRDQPRNVWRKKSSSGVKRADLTVRTTGGEGGRRWMAGTADGGTS